MSNSTLLKVIKEFHADLLESWLAQLKLSVLRLDKKSEVELRQLAGQFLQLIQKPLEKGYAGDIESSYWDDVRQLLKELSQTRVRQGYSPIETATFIFSLKEPLFAYLRQTLSGSPEAMVEETSATSMLFDRLGLFTIEVYQKAREEIIIRQQQELLELSTPVVQLWKNILALPLIGTLDSSRTQIVMENLLQKVMETGSLIAIIDITGVPTVDTLVAQHLLKTISATRLMGADCIISGIRPQIAQTIVHLGVNLDDVVTKATLADAFMVALKRTGATVTSSDK